MLPEVFGITGMSGGEDMPFPKMEPVVINPAADLTNIIKYPTLVATAPLTNLALNIQANPDFTKTVKHIYIMGGSAYPEPVHNRFGNLRVDGSDEYAEYNFAVDPDSFIGGGSE